jgi:hypothetical protein
MALAHQSTSLARLGMAPPSHIATAIILEHEALASLRGPQGRNPATVDVADLSLCLQPVQHGADAGGRAIAHLAHLFDAFPARQPHFAGGGDELQ